jgi:hypothetical protein
LCPLSAPRQQPGPHQHTTGFRHQPPESQPAPEGTSRVTDDDALGFARILDSANETRAALVALMKTIARYGRPTSLPDDVRAAWDECENIVGDDTVAELVAVASQGARERERQRPTRRRASTRLTAV